MSTVDPLGGDAEDPGAPTINEKMSTAPPLGGIVRDPGVPTINTKNVDGGPPDPHGGGGLVCIQDLKGVL
jgi:hypothetical protein